MLDILLTIAGWVVIIIATLMARHRLRKIYGMPSKRRR